MQRAPRLGGDRSSPRGVNVAVSIFLLVDHGTSPLFFLKSSSHERKVFLQLFPHQTLDLLR
jgi:hypothetical protein